MSDPDDSQNPRAGDPIPPDAVLLQRYAGQADQQAFAELVHRHSGWVFSIAKRRSGQTDLAQECSQNVFLALARKAPRLVSFPCLAPWLHRAAVLETAALLRKESRYRHAMKRHQDESALHETPDAVTEAWQAMRAQVDEALNSLPGADREVLIRHHVEGRTFPEIARDLGATEAAAQRRGHRALEKLTARLRRCGVALPVTVLGAALASGMKAEAALARPVMSGILQTVGTTGSKATAAAGGAHVFPAWVASPAMLAAIALVSAGVPVWWGTATQAGMPAVKANLLASKSDALKASAIPAVTRPAVPTDSALSFLRQALAQLRKEPSSGEPTKLGLHLRKYMLGLTEEELGPVGRLLGEVPGYEGEFPAILGAFSTRLAQADPVLALELLGSGKDKGDGKDGGIRFSRTAIMDVLSRGPHLPEVLRICGRDKDLNVKLISGWATHDGPAAGAYAEQILTESPGRFDRSTYLMPWLMSAPADAVKWLDTQAEAKPAIYERADSMFGTLGNWAVQQMPSREAVELTLGLRDPVVRNDFVSGLYQAYSRKQPEVLAGLAPLLQVEDHAKPLSVAHVLTAWRRKDEPAAAAWVQSMPDGDLKTAAHRSLARPLPAKP